MFEPFPVTIVICKEERNTLCSMVSLDDTDGKSDAAVNKRGTIRVEAASKREIGSVEKMSKAVEARTYEDALAWLREHGFDVLEAPGTNGRVFLRKYNVSAAIQKTAEDGVKIFAYPGYLIRSEISKLVNRGYQQFLKNSKTEVPATAEHLKA